MNDWWLTWQALAAAVIGGTALGLALKLVV